MQTKTDDRRKLLLTIIGLLAVSLFVRVLTVGWHGLSCDEAQLIGIVTLPDLGEMLSAVAVDGGNPPLMHLLVRLFIQFFGQSDVSLKSFAVIISSIFPIVVFLSLRKSFGLKIAIQTALLSAFCPFVVANSNILRPYGLLAIGTVMLTSQLFSLIETPRSWVERTKYGILLVCMMYLHPFAVAVPAGHALLMFVGLVCRWWGRSALQGWLISVAIGVIAYLPWLSVSYINVKHSRSLWQADCTPLKVIGLMMIELATQMLNSHFEVEHMMTGILVLVMAIFVQPAVFFPKFAKDIPDKATVRRWYIVALGSFSAMFIIFNIIPFVRDRYMSHLAVFPLLFFATSLDSIFTPKNRYVQWAGLLAPFLIVLPAWLPQLKTIADYPNSRVYEIVQSIKQKADPAKDLIVVAWEPAAPEFTRILPSEYRAIAFPDLYKVQWIKYLGVDRRIRDEDNYIQAENLMDKALEAGGAIWFYQRTFREPALKALSTQPLTNTDDHRFAELKASQRLKDWCSAHARMDGPTQVFQGREALIGQTRFVRAR